MCPGCSDVQLGPLLVDADDLEPALGLAAPTLDWPCGAPASSAVTATAPPLSSLALSAPITSLIELRI